MYFFSNSPVKWRLTKVVYLEKVVSVVIRQRKQRSRVCKRSARSAEDRSAHLASTTVTNKHELEGGSLLCASLGHGCGVLVLWSNEKR